MALTYRFTSGRVPEGATDNEIFTVSTLLMVTGVDELNEKTIPVIVKRYNVGMALEGRDSNVSSYIPLLKKYSGMTANVTRKTFRQFLKGQLDWVKDLEIPRK